MFEARFSSATLLKRIIDSVKDLVSDVNLLCTEDGIELQSMDSAHVALVNFTILVEACTLYNCSESLTLGIHMATLSKVLKCAENTDSVHLVYEEDKAVLCITFESQNGNRTASYYMNLMDIDSEHLAIPETPYSSSIKMKSSEFTRIVKDLSGFGDNVSLTVKEGLFILETKGDTGTATVQVKQDKTAKSQLEWTDIECAEDTTMMLSLTYLVAFTKAQSISEQVSIFMLKDVPVYVTYDMGDKGSVGFYLAPKMTE